MTPSLPPEPRSEEHTVSAFGLEKLAPELLREDAPFEYVLRIKNGSSAPLEGVVVVESVVSQISIENAWPASQIPGPHLGRWVIGNVAAGASVEIRVQARAMQAMPFRSHTSLSFSSHS